MSVRKRSEAHGTDSFVSYRGYFLPPNIEEARLTNRELDKFELTDEDLLVVGFPKSGATRMTLLLREMYDNWGLIEAAGRKVVAQLEWSVSQFHTEGAVGIAKKMFATDPTDMTTSRRLIKTRLPYPIVPEKLREGKICKVIYISRNPKDVCVNYYSFEKSSLPLGEDGEPIPWEAFVQNFAEGLVVYGPWLNHVTEWLKHRDDDNFLHVSYEDLMQKPDTVIRTLAEFIGYPLDEVAVKRLSRFRADGTDKDPDMKGVKKGVIGEWKKHFSEEQSKMFDRDIGMMLKAKNLDFLYTPYQ
ncbi:sulfotransferase 1B1-like [Saccoglossus kowalevskii]|uniref:Sulfotransferase 1C4-like n=1 Tax=Saccoglossus kowalevskii TaxID=10224 RepID=A0ABM0MKX8_SACKO|nr:PREDICTED: sulfotransferase 1C4-like [Saccoglossus kowalevskii]